jgi:hypothetical protein
MASRKRAHPHFRPLGGVIKNGSSGPGLFTFHPEMALLFYLYVSAQSLDFLDLAEKCLISGLETASAYLLLMDTVQ